MGYGGLRRPIATCSIVSPNRAKLIYLPSLWQDAASLISAKDLLTSDKEENK
jgi:hypothetical protein